MEKPDWKELIAALDKKEAEVKAVKAKSEPEKAEPVSEKLRVNEPLTESQQWAADAPERERKLKAAKAERERVARVENRCETVEEYQTRRRQEQARASAEWHQAMGYPRMEWDEGLGEETLKKKTTPRPPIGEEIHHVQPTPMMNIVFESGLLVKQERWSMQAIETIMSEMKDAGFSNGLIEKLKAKFYERIE